MPDLHYDFLNKTKHKHSPWNLYNKKMIIIQSTNQRNLQPTQNIDIRCYVKAYTLTKYEMKPDKLFTKVSIEG